ncbi:hypothetical protein VPH35_139775 [Triticum aestivum]|uniref:Uncharacterized protein n=1 Tax=Aegilops tauschii subsp. strangulata TaxID=200361 RepID=A0A453SZU0_AEGTS
MLFFVSPLAFFLPASREEALEASLIQRTETGRTMEWSGARAQSFRKIIGCLSPRFSSLYCHISFCNLLHALYSQQKYFFLSIEKESIAGQAVGAFYRNGTKRS